MNTSERDQAVRALLVDTAHRRQPRRRRSTAFIAVVAFLLGGGLATGAVSAAVAATRAPIPVSVQPNAFDQMLQGGHTLGPLVTYTGSRDAHLDVGSRPVGATGIMYFLQCGTGRGKILSISLGGTSDLGTSLCTGGSGFGSFTEQDPTDSLVTITTDGNFSYSVWAQWFAVPPPIQPSTAQMAAIADGKITRDELHAAVDRTAACMTGAGYPPTITEYEPAPSFSYSGDVPAGVTKRCYDAELTKVVAIWDAQGEHE